jgi:hypothetical protein
VTVELVPLANARIQLRDPIVLGETPAGTRMIIEVESGEMEGDRLRGALKGANSADWFTIGPDFTGTLDVRALFETHDGALVFMQYFGRTDLSVPNSPIYTAPRFETGDDRYKWLNRVQAIAKGALDGNSLTYEILEVR